MRTKFFVVAVGLLATIALQGCKHPLAIVGEGDIVDVNNSGHGCTLEQFRSQDKACTENEVSGDYFVNYKAVPRSGWRFVRWDGPCPPDSDFQHCRLHIAKVGVDWWDQTYPDRKIPPSTAIFAPMTGETGYLLAGTPVAGVAWETRTQQGVTGLDGSFQYEEGETVRFIIGNTLLGQVTGQEQVTPFDLAGSPVLTGIDITWGLQDVVNGSLFSEADTDVDPFQAVINIAVLLQSLDHDGDPENGIQIRPGVTTLFQSLRLEVSQHWRRFQNEPTLRHAMGKASREHRFSTAHGVVKPAVAAEHLYRTLGIDARTVGVNLLNHKVSNPNPGTSIERWQYDANGNVTQQDALTWQYDANGNVTQHWWNGNPRDTWEYDLNGNVIRHETLGRDDIEIETWQYNNDGNVTREWKDRNADGTPDYVGRFEYDTNGHLTRNVGADGSLAGIETWRYDASGNKTYYQSTIMGVTAIEETRQYDAHGNLIRVKGRYIDVGRSGVPYIDIREYDANGNVIRKERDSGADGTLDSIETLQYDANGNVTRRVTRNPDGTVDSLENLQYDGNGNVTRHEEGGGANGALYRIGTWQYDVFGNMTRHEMDELADGKVDNIETYQYDLTGNITRYDCLTRPSCGDRRFDTWQYDADGNLTRHERREKDGTTIVTYQYEATGWGHLFPGFGFDQLRYPLPPKPNPEL